MAGRGSWRDLHGLEAPSFIPATHSRPDMITSKDVMADLQAFVRNEVSDPKTGDACAAAVLECFGLNFRYQTIYVPTQTQRNKEVSQRNKDILSDFIGHNHNELAIKYRLSLQTIYKIIRESRRKAESGEKPLKPILLLVVDEYLPPDLIKAGLSESDAMALSQKVADYLCDKYPGVMFHMVDVVK